MITFWLVIAFVIAVLAIGAWIWREIRADRKEQQEHEEWMRSLRDPDERWPPRDGL